jgi:hypothetical protein
MSLLGDLALLEADNYIVHDPIRSLQKMVGSLPSILLKM